MKITLIDDWQTVWHKLWSARLSFLAGILGVLDAAFQYYTSGQPPVIVIAATISSFAAFFARFVAQEGISSAADPAPTPK